jgi:hypothetical protein
MGVSGPAKLLRIATMEAVPLRRGTAMLTQACDVEPDGLTGSLHHFFPGPYPAGKRRQAGGAIPAAVFTRRDPVEDLVDGVVHGSPIALGGGAANCHPSGARGTWSLATRLPVWRRAW